MGFLDFLFNKKSSENKSTINSGSTDAEESVSRIRHDTEQYSYEIVGNREVEIIRYNGEDESVDIPKTIDGLPVTKIGKQAFAGTDVVEVNVPEGVETIETEAFAICDSLQRITLPASLTTLGQGVFKGSEELSQIEFPNKNQHFAVEDGVLYNLDKLALVVCPPGLKKETFTIPMGIMVIAAGAFYQNSSLKYVKLPITLEKIETEAFLFTPLMQMIELPPKLKVIEPDSFMLTPTDKPFMIYAFADSVGYKYAVDNHIPVHQLLWILKD